MEQYLPLLEKIPMFHNLDRDCILSILKHADTRISRHQKNEFILRAGEQNPYICFLLEGSAFIFQEDVWGNRNLISSLKKGQSFGESYACASDTDLLVSVQTDSPCTVLHLQVERLLSDTGCDIPGRTRFIQNLIHDLAGKNIKFNEKLNHLGQRSTRGKLLSYLSVQSRKNNSLDFTIPFNRQQLADYLYIDRSGLSAELCKMRDEGILSFEKNHFILHTIHDLL